MAAKLPPPPLGALALYYDLYVRPYAALVVNPYPDGGADLYIIRPYADGTQYARQIQQADPAAPLPNSYTLSSTGVGGPAYVLPPATTTTLGGVIVGAGLAVQPDGTLSTTGTPASGPAIFSIREVTADTTLTATDYSIVVIGANPVTVTLPAAPATGQVFHVKNARTTRGVLVTVNGAGALIDGNATTVLDAYAGLTMQWSGSQWRSM